MLSKIFPHIFFLGNFFSASCHAAKKPTKLSYAFFQVHILPDYDEETTLERAVSPLNVCIRGNGENNVYSFFVSCCPHSFMPALAERVETRKALTNRPRRQLFLM